MVFKEGRVFEANTRASTSVLFAVGKKQKGLPLILGAGRHMILKSVSLSVNVREEFQQTSHCSSQMNRLTDDAIIGVRITLQEAE